MSFEGRQGMVRSYLNLYCVVIGHLVVAVSGTDDACDFMSHSRSVVKWGNLCDEER
jgi:hypothetical protein